MLTVYTAAVGETDKVQAPDEVVEGVRYLCFSDRQPPAPYVWIPVERTAEDEGITIRRFKVLADHALLGDGPTLWHDASYRLKVGTVGRVEEVLYFCDVACLAHPRRTTIEQEGQAVARYRYVTPEMADAIVRGYRALGFTDKGLSSGGLLARSGTAPRRLGVFNRAWWNELVKWNYRDQASLDFAAWTSAVRIRHLPGTPRSNPFATWRRSDKATGAAA